MYALTNCKIYTGSDVLDNHAVIIDGVNIHSVCPVAELPTDLKPVDLDGSTVSPGFIDLPQTDSGGVR